MVALLLVLFLVVLIALEGCKNTKIPLRFSHNQVTAPILSSDENRRKILEPDNWTLPDRSTNFYGFAGRVFPSKLMTSSL